MPQAFYIVPVQSGDYPSNELPPVDAPGSPIIGGGPVLPPQIWPPKGFPSLPPGIWDKPPGLGLWPIKPPDFPIVVPRPPEKPEPGLPDVWPPQISTGPILPDMIWPPLPPDTGIAGKAAILIWVVGVGYRWLLVSTDKPVGTPMPEPK